AHRDDPPAAARVRRAQAARAALRHPALLRPAGLSRLRPLGELGGGVGAIREELRAQRGRRPRRPLGRRLARPLSDVSPVTTTLDVRGTPARLQRAGDGAPLLFLHGAGAAGRWFSFQDALAQRFDVIAPTHPGHGGSPAAEWIEDISDLAFHYLDLLDALKLERVHLVGASLGGWIAAEIAVMASHRLSSLVLIDPVGIKVEGWI